MSTIKLINKKLDELLTRLFLRRSSIKKRILKIFRTVTSPLRTLPDFIIIGAARSGTTSLYNYLIQHPLVNPAWTKEIRYFDIKFKKGIYWYKAFFPTRFFKSVFKFIHKQDVFTCEASPFYIVHPRTARRVFSVLPDIKIIVLLRNPIDRAFSHYFMKGAHREGIVSFEEIIKLSKNELNSALQSLKRNEDLNIYEFNRYSHLVRGIYVVQLKKWFTYFPKEKILIIKSEEFFKKTPEVLNEVYKFLNLPYYDINRYKPYNVGKHSNMADKTRKELAEFFKPYNEELYKFLGRKFGWEEN